MKIINCSLEVELEPRDLDVILSEKAPSAELDDSFLLTLEAIYQTLQSSDLFHILDATTAGSISFKEWLIQTNEMQNFFASLDAFHSRFRELYDSAPISLIPSTNSRLNALAYCADVFSDLSVPPAFLRLTGLKEVSDTDLQTLQDYFCVMRKIYDKYVDTVTLPEHPGSAFIDMYHYWLTHHSQD